MPGALTVNRKLKWVAAVICALTTFASHAEVSVQFTALLERHALANGVDITQFGDLNVAAVTQSGQGHYALLLQQGVLNQLLLQQTGTGQRAQISQYGNNNSALVIQHGQNNQIQIEQWGNRHFSIEQSGVGEAISIVQY